MKKLISCVLVCVLMLTTLTVVSYADVSDYEGAFGVITNAAGEIVRIIPMPRQAYLDKAFTLTPGDTLTTYQYEPNSVFGAGFKFANANGEKTTKNGTVLIELFGSSTIGSDGKTRLKEYTFSTNLEDNKGKNPYYENVEGDHVVLSVNPTSTMRYFNARYTNKSSFTINLCVLVCMD